MTEAEARAKHTPGPWWDVPKAKKIDIYAHGPHAAKLRHIAEVLGDRNDAEALACARLDAPEPTP